MDGAEEGSVWDGGGHRYCLEKIVGNGAFGVVWRARAEDGTVVAIKKVMLDRRYHNRELQMMKVMDHDNVVRLRHYFEKGGRKKDETYLHLVMDYLPETIRSVAMRYHKRAQRFSIEHVKAYLWQTFRALEYIHARRICHRDIKPDNLLCDPGSLQCRLCDFGCSKVWLPSSPFDVGHQNETEGMLRITYPLTHPHCESHPTLILINLQSQTPTDVLRVEFHL